MRILKTYALWLGTILLILSCSSQAQEPKHAKGENSTDEKVLIVYLSRTKNTKTVAEIIQQKVGGDLVSLELVNPYPEHYQTTVNQVADENSKDYFPPLKTKIDSIEKYDIIFVGFPTWGMQLPPPMKSFLKQYNLSGKTVVPFNTNGGYGIGNTFETVKKLCTNSKVLEGFSTKGGVERDGTLFVMEGDKKNLVQNQVQKWLKKIGLIN